jgi:hypothetical protein
VYDAWLHKFKATNSREPPSTVMVWHMQHSKEPKANHKYSNECDNEECDKDELEVYSCTNNGHNNHEYNDTIEESNDDNGGKYLCYSCLFIVTTYYLMFHNHFFLFGLTM